MYSVLPECFLISQFQRCSVLILNPNHNILPLDNIRRLNIFHLLILKIREQLVSNNGFLRIPSCFPSALVSYPLCMPVQSLQRTYPNLPPLSYENVTPTPSLLFWFLTHASIYAYSYQFSHNNGTRHTKHLAPYPYKLPSFLLSLRRFHASELLFKVLLTDFARNGYKAICFKLFIHLLNNLVCIWF